MAELNLHDILFQKHVFSLIFIYLRHNIVKAMDQLDHVTAMIAITVCKVNQKLIIKIDLLYQTDLFDSLAHVCLVRKTDFNY